jgi:hypothetical protein
VPSLPSGPTPSLNNQPVTTWNLPVSRRLARSRLLPLSLPPTHTFLPLRPVSFRIHDSSLTLDSGYPVGSTNSIPSRRPRSSTSTPHICNFRPSVTQSFHAAANCPLTASMSSSIAIPAPAGSTFDFEHRRRSSSKTDVGSSPSSSCCSSPVASEHGGNVMSSRAAQKKKMGHNRRPSLLSKLVSTCHCAHAHRLSRLGLLPARVHYNQHLPRPGWASSACKSPSCPFASPAPRGR